MTSEDIDNQTICRFCREPETPDQMLSPCNCRGSIAFIHRRCLIDWIKFKNSVYLCQQLYDIVEVHHPGFGSFVVDRFADVLTFAIIFLVLFAVMWFALLQPMVPFFVTIVNANFNLMVKLICILLLLVGILVVGFPLGFFILMFAGQFADVFDTWREMNTQIVIPDG